MDMQLSKMPDASSFLHLYLLERHMTSFPSQPVCYLSVETNSTNHIQSSSLAQFAGVRLTQVNGFC